MSHLNPRKTGLALGTLLAGVHLVWAVLIALGWAQSLVDFSMWAHMLKMPATVQAFDLSAAIAVVIVAAVIGYMVGFAFAKIWNWLHR